MADLNTIVQGWKAHVKRPVDCKNCPYLGGKGCSAGLDEDTYLFLLELQERTDKNETLA